MARSHPRARVHDDAGIQAHDVLAQLGHAPPPKLFHVPLKLGTKRAVIPKTVDSPVNLAGLKNETAAFAEGDYFLHSIRRFRGRLRHKGDELTTPLASLQEQRKEKTE